MNWMIFYREKDMEYFLFNEKWPISISPEGHPWGEDSGNSVLERIAVAERDIKDLYIVLASRKKVFTINKIRYVVEQRGTFKTE